MPNRLRAAVLMLLCLPAFAHAEDEPPPRWTFGALAIDRNAPYRGLDEGLLFMPLLRFEGERAYIRGLRGGINLHKVGGFGFDAFAQFRGDGYDADDSDFLEGMDDRNFSLDAGLAATWRNDNFGQLELSLATDVMGRSGGQEMEFSYTALFHLGGWTLVPSLAVKWQSEDLVDYYYGVRADEALPGRPAYSPGADLQPEVALIASRRLGAHWSLFARFSHTRLPDEKTDSPLVDVERRTGVILGLGWSPAAPD